MRLPGPAFPAWAGPAERLRFLLRWAVRAPSRRNAQPWLFDVEGPELRVHVDPRRSLRATDPQGREATIACGAAIENLVLAAAHHGHAVDVEPRDPAAGGPVAVARLVERRLPSAAEEELFAAIPIRRTAFALDARPVTPEELSALAAEVGPEGRVRRVPRWLARPVAELVAEADAIQRASARFRAEEALWAPRPGRRPAGEPADGRPGPPSPASLLRRLLRRARGRLGRELDRRCDERTRSLLLVSTPDDGPREWLAAGRALQRLLLRAAASGLSVTFLSQPIEVADTRRRLRRELGDPGLPQLLLRVGHGPAPRPTPRRPVDLVLRGFASDLSVEVGIEAAEPAPLARPG